MNLTTSSTPADDSAGSEISNQVAPIALAMEIDIRAMLQPIRDQGERPTCLAFATTASHEWARTQNEATVEDLSEEVLCWGAKQLDDDPEPGLSFYAAAGALKQWGQPAESVWPYDDLLDESESSYQPPKGAIEPSICHKAILMPIESSVLIIKEFLSQSRLVAIGIPIWSSFQASTNGQIPMPSITDTNLGGHAISIVGYRDLAPSTTSSTGVTGLASAGYFIFRNSWGEEWGDGGYGYLPYEYVSNYETEAWAI